MHRTVMWSVAALASLSMSGCHRYVEIAPEMVSPGDVIRVTLDRQEALRLAGERGELQEELTGTATEQTDERRLGMSYVGTRGSDFRDYLEVQWDAVQRVEGQEISWVRTAGLGALAAVVTVAILEIADESAGKNGEGGGINESQWTRIPFWSLRW